MKKSIALVLSFLLFLSACGIEPIGTISGAENEFITIEDTLYILDTGNAFSHVDKGNCIGKVSNSDITMKIYSVKGDPERNYLYALWDWEGSFYKKQEQIH